LPLRSPLTVILFSSTILSCACYSVIAPFMPVEMRRKGVDDVMRGYIIAVFSLVVIFGSSAMGFGIQKLGRRVPMYTGSLLLTVSFWAYALISDVENKNWYVFWSFAVRVLQGAAFILIQVTCLSIAANFYKSNTELLIGLLEAAAGLGLMLGPLIGTGFFAIGGYKFMLVCMGIVFLVGTVAMAFVFADFLDDYTERDKRALSERNQAADTEDYSLIGQISYRQIFSIPAYLLPCLAGLLGYLIYDYQVPILGLRLIELGLSQNQTGLFFGIWSASYVIASLAVGYLPKSVPKRVWITSGLFLSCLF
jgi:MFS family permease